jgi:hypothetical protein
MMLSQILQNINNTLSLVWATAGTDAKLSEVVPFKAG